MRSKSKTSHFYIESLGFRDVGEFSSDQYLILEKDGLQIHFFEYESLDPSTNYGQVYLRTNDIDNLYETYLRNKVDIHPNGHIGNRDWNQREFSLLDPDNNLLTFGQRI